MGLIGFSQQTTSVAAKAHVLEPEFFNIALMGTLKCLIARGQNKWGGGLNIERNGINALKCKIILI